MQKHGKVSSLLPAIVIGTLLISGNHLGGTELTRKEPEPGKRLYEITEACPDPAFAFDRNGKIAAWNRSLEQLTSIPSCDAIGEDQAKLSLTGIGTIMPQPSILKSGVGLQETAVRLQETAVKHSTVRDRHDNGVIIAIQHDKQESIYRLNVKEIYDEGHDHIGSIETFTDITELYGIIRKYQYIDSMQQAIMQMVPCSIHAVDDRRQTTGYNDQFLKLLGITDTETDKINWKPWLKTSEGLLSRISDPVQYFRILNEVYQLENKPSEHVLELIDGRKVKQCSMPVLVGNQIAGRVWSYTELPGNRPAQDSNMLCTDRDSLIWELHHCVKNNLQIISSLQSLQAHTIEDTQGRKIYQRCQDRVKSMALIYENVHMSDDQAYIDFTEYLHMLTKHLSDSFLMEAGKVALKMDVPPIYLNIDNATPCGLVISELVANCMVHAFPGEVSGEIWIEAAAEDGHVTISIGDDGIGFPDSLDYRKTSTLGLQIACSLTEQLDGSLQMCKGKGTVFELSFTYPN